MPIDPIRILICAAAGVVCGIVCILWVRFLLQKRKADYSLSPGKEKLICALMAFPGAAVGALLTDVVPIVCGMLLLCLCMTFSLTDWMHRIIPNPTVLGLLILKAAGIPTLFGVAGFLPFDIVGSLLGLVVCFLIFSLPALFGKKVGAGDVKIAAAMGFFLGLSHSLLAVMIMGLLVILFGMMQRKMTILNYLRSMIPMGPFIAIGLFVIYLGSFYLP